MMVEKLEGRESLDCKLRGHTKGHILSELVLLYISIVEEQYRLKGDSLVTSLAEVQKTLNQDYSVSAYHDEKY